MQIEANMNYDYYYDDVRTKTRDKYFGRGMHRKSKHGSKIARLTTHREIKEDLNNRVRF